MGYTRNEQITVTNASQVIMQSMESAGTIRKAFVIRNTADDVTKIITLVLSNNQGAVSQNGIVLKQGEVYYESSDLSMNAWNGSIQAICAVASATADVSIFERVE